MAVSGTFGSEARRDALVENLLANGSLELSSVATEWDVHPMTIRRDFDAFVTAGIARRVRGGIVAVGGDDFGPRSHRHAEAKRAICLKLRTLVESGATVGLDSSTTVFPLVEMLDGVVGVSVVTNGLTAFQALQGRDNVRAFLTGGEREDQNISLVGPLTVRSFQQFNLDVAFVSAMSIDADRGTSELTPEQVEVKEAMVAAADLAVLAIDSSKFGTRARSRSLPVGRFDVLVTDLEPSDPRLDPYRGIVDRVL